MNSTATGKPIPQATPDTKPFWDAALEERLLLPNCAECGPFFYPRSHCPNCGSDQIGWFEASGEATLYSYIINHTPPGPGFENEAPYVIAVVQLKEGPRMMANILGVPATPEALPLDLPLQVTFETRGNMKIPQFKPAGAKS